MSHAIDLGNAGLQAAGKPVYEVRAGDETIFEAPWNEVRRNRVLNPTAAENATGAGVYGGATSVTREVIGGETWFKCSVNPGGYTGSLGMHLVMASDWEAGQRGAASFDIRMGAGQTYSGTLTVLFGIGGSSTAEIVNLTDTPQRITRTVPSLLAPGAFATRLYIGATTEPWSHGDEIYIRRVIDSDGPYFDGSTPPKVRENASPNPLAANGMAGPISNAGAQNPLLRGQAVPPGNPEGFTTGASQRYVSTYPFLINVYNLGSEGNTGMPRMSGAWVYIDSEYDDWQIEATAGHANAPIPANQWVWVASSNPITGYSGLRTSRLGLAEPGPDDRGYFTGITISEGTEPVTSSLVPGHSTAPQGYALAWEGAPNASRSYMYDAYERVRWLGTPNASASVLEKLGSA